MSQEFILRYSSIQAFFLLVSQTFSPISCISLHLYLLYVLVDIEDINNIIIEYYL